jgi:hypothetical protein
MAFDRLGIRAAEALYVGDRADVDGRAASAAGVACAILRRAGRALEWATTLMSPARGTAGVSRWTPMPACPISWAPALDVAFANDLRTS